MDEAVVNLDVILLEGHAGGGNLLARDHFDFSRETSLVKLTLGDVVENDILEAVVAHEVHLGETLRLGEVTHGVVVRRENRDRAFRGEFTGNTRLFRCVKRNETKHQVSLHNTYKDGGVSRVCSSPSRPTRRESAGESAAPLSASRPARAHIDAARLYPRFNKGRRRHTRRVFHALQDCQSSRRSSKRRNLSSSRRTDRLDNKPPLARIRFSNRLKNRHPSRTYLGDGGTEEGVGRSLTNHTYRSFASPFVSQSINPMRRRDRGIQSIRCDAMRRIRVGISSIHPSIHPLKKFSTTYRTHRYRRTARLLHHPWSSYERWWHRGARSSSSWRRRTRRWWSCSLGRACC